MNSYRLKLIALCTEDASSLSVPAYANLHRPHSPKSTIGPNSPTESRSTRKGSSMESRSTWEGVLPRCTHGVERDSPLSTDVKT